MPIFEYRCESCGHHFEQLTRGDRAPSCPACHGQALAKQLSTFAVATGGGGTRAAGAASSAAHGMPCGSCGDPRGPGACSMN
jgi:putative FmdB family regulatory protein